MGPYSSCAPSSSGSFRLQIVRLLQGSSALVTEGANLGTDWVGRRPTDERLEEGFDTRVVTTVDRSRRPCSVHLENQKVFKIFRYIKFFDICMKH
jgi:hypothetical protein